MLKSGEPLNPNVARSRCLKPRDGTTASIWMSPLKSTEAVSPHISSDLVDLEFVCSVLSVEKVSAAAPASGHLLILLQYELSARICLCYSGTPNSIPPSCLILHNERLPAAHRIMPPTDAFHNGCTYFIPFEIFLERNPQKRQVPASCEVNN